MEGDGEQVEGRGAVAAGEIVEEFEQFGDGAAGGLLFMGGEEIGEVCGDAVVVAKGFGVVGVETERSQLGKEDPGEGGQEQGVEGPGIAGEHVAKIRDLAGAAKGRMVFARNGGNGYFLFSYWAISSVGQSACLTSRMSPVQVWDRPPSRRPLRDQGPSFYLYVKYKLIYQ